MTYLYESEEGIEYPLTEQDIKNKFKNVSWEMDNFSPPNGYFLVTNIAKPADTISTVYEEGAPEKNEDGVYSKVWNSIELDAELVTARLNRARDKLKMLSKAKRTEIEKSGLEIGGIQLKTSVEDQNRITSIITNAEFASIESVDFKSESGWVVLSLDQIKGLAGAIASHIQKCFSVNKAIDTKIDTDINTQEDIDNFDINQEWEIAYV